MPESTDQVYRTREQIISELVAAWQARVPDVQPTADSIIRIWIETFAYTAEGLYLAAQLLHDDIWPQTANALALFRFGELYGRALKTGTKATGTVRFSGAGGVEVPLGTLVAAPRATDEALRFVTTATVTLPEPGEPSAPVAADDSAGSLAAGTYEWAVTFVTAGGETALGEPSNALVLAANRRAGLTAIPVGGPGTTERRLYRRVNGGDWQLVPTTTSLDDNVTTTYIDNNTTGLGGAPPDESTAERVTATAESEDTGEEANAAIGTITQIVDAVEGLAEVTNLTTFTGASNDEDIEEYRSAVIRHIRAPRTGSPDDLQVIAEAIEGVETATVFKNDNEGTPAAGHVTVRISGPEGSVPSAEVIAAVLAELEAQDLANATIHVTGFTAVSRDVTVDVTPATGFTLAEITADVEGAITDYIQSVPVGGTLRVAGIYWAVFDLLGVETLVVSVPAADQTHAATEKPVAGVLTVT